MTRHRVALGAAVVAIALGVVVARAVWQGRAALARGDQALAARDTDGAVRWWRRAARWYVPLAPHVEGAYARLAELATQAEAAGDRGTALAAWQGIRGAVLATRSVYVPFEERLAAADARIAALMAAWEAEGARDASPLAERVAWHAERLARDDAPSVGWTLLAMLGLAGSIGGAALFAWRGVDEADALVGRVAAIAGLLVAGGLVVWMLGLSQA